MPKIKCKINNKDINVRDGVTINEELNEKLDSGTIQFVTHGGVADIEPFDPVTLNITFSFPKKVERVKQLTDAFDCGIVQFNDSLEESDYLYVVNLFSETKILERITCPSLSITHKEGFDPSIQGYVRNYTVWDKIKQYCRMFLPREFVYQSMITERKVEKCILKYDRDMETKFSMECPEMSWQEPTLREVLTDLMSVANCIPIVKDNVLTYLDLEYRGNEIDTSLITNIKHSATSADYCDELTLPLKNVISKSSTRIEWITPRTDESLELTTQNLKIITQKPIYNIKSFKVYSNFQIWNEEKGTNDTYLRVIDLMNCHLNRYVNPINYVVENDEYNLLSPRTYDVDGSSNTFSYQFCMLHYKRGSNVIENVGESVTYKTSGAWSSATTERIYLAVASAFGIREFGDSSVANLWDYANGQHLGIDVRRNFIIRIEYETIDESTINVGKLRNIRNSNNKLFDGQSSQTVDFDNQTIQEYSKANRLGNKIMTIFGEYQYSQKSKIPKLADRIGDKVLFSRSLTYWDNQINFKGELIDNYILKDYFTGIISKRRSWQIASNQESVIRHDVLKLYLTASFQHQEGFNTRYNTLPFEISGGGGTAGSEFYWRVFNNIFGTHIDFVNVKSALVNFKDAYHNEIPEEETIYRRYIVMETNVNAVGRSVVIDYGFIDNAIAGYRLTVASDPTYQSSIIKYCDQFGENHSGKILLCNRVDGSEADLLFDFDSKIANLINPDTWDYDDWLGCVEYINKKPLFDIRNYQSAVDVMCIQRNYIYKDNRETLKTTIQLELTSDDDNIIVTDKLASYMNQVYDGQKQVKIYRLTSGKYSPNEIVARGTYEPSWSVVLHEHTPSSVNELGYQRISLFVGSNRKPYTAWCICDNNDNILLANNDGTDRTENIIFEFRYFRDKNVYNSQIDKIKIGESWEKSQLDAKYAANPPTIDSIKVLGKTIEVSSCKDFEEDDE